MKATSRLNLLSRADLAELRTVVTEAVCKHLGPQLQASAERAAAEALRDRMDELQELATRVVAETKRIDAILRSTDRDNAARFAGLRRDLDTIGAAVAALPILADAEAANRRAEGQQTA